MSTIIRAWTPAAGHRRFAGTVYGINIDVLTEWAATPQSAGRLASVTRRRSHAQPMSSESS